MGGYGLLTAGWPEGSTLGRGTDIFHPALLSRWFSMIFPFPFGGIPGHVIVPWKVPQKWRQQLEAGKKTCSKAHHLWYPCSFSGVGSDLEWWILHPFSLVVTACLFRSSKLLGRSLDLHPRQISPPLSLDPQKPYISHTIHGNCIFTYMNGLNLW